MSFDYLTICYYLFIFQFSFITHGARLFSKLTCFKFHLLFYFSSSLFSSVLETLILYPETQTPSSLCLMSLHLLLVFFIQPDNMSLLLLLHLSLLYHIHSFSTPFPVTPLFIPHFNFIGENNFNLSLISPSLSSKKKVFDVCFSQVSKPPIFNLFIYLTPFLLCHSCKYLLFY